MNELIDALPYVDKEYDEPHYQKIVHDLIEEEMSMFEPKNYLGERNLDSYSLKFKPGSILSNEFSRVSKGIPMSDIDRERYEVNPPSKESVEEWRKATNNAKSQLQHQVNRVMNLELLGTYGTNAWLHHNKRLEGLEKVLTLNVKRLRKSADEINIKRQEAQIEAKRLLFNVSSKRYELSDKNLQIELANASLREEKKCLQSAHKD
mmetsp:Transcript_12397/g.18594  ORF Transcript_12397/g.18594 Transcript_12397/m.18594 type:complete len:206 (-) Transcript_12397:59-676(-)|eukprot:CAMPEP_0171458842 /NCGR_PEP_ID=MMETSP0945-20130129/4362_1 /TAXON_ID=109269 /ORGANISM="Vaucheria litorea, Strain CCMP2940" /LENGTH=205 /DNA_ID=CAMNT_0011984737 /DNA_START=93 /DNA_END=710 /DNA_ORIENTATION=-